MHFSCGSDVYFFCGSDVYFSRGSDLDSGFLDGRIWIRVLTRIGSGQSKNGSSTPIRNYYREWDLAATATVLLHVFSVLSVVQTIFDHALVAPSERNDSQEQPTLYFQEQGPS